jgi:release factor glutamine methyltransferase
MTTAISPRALHDAITRLRAAGCVFAEDEAAVLSASAAGEEEMSALVRRRAAGEPLEQVVGYADFCGVRVTLRPGVFVPRVRSGVLVRLAAEQARRLPGPLVVDLCCGSGALGAAVVQRVPGVVLHAADLDPVAVACARDNLAGVGTVHQGDLYAALPVALRGHVDVLLANVPYVPTRHLPLLPAEARLHEAPMALDGGHDGLDVFRAVAAAAVDWLAPGGVLLSEITDAQVAAAEEALRAVGLDPAVHHDDDLEATAVLGLHRPGPTPVPGTRPLR